MRLPVLVVALLAGCTTVVPDPAGEPPVTETGLGPPGAFQAPVTVTGAAPLVNTGEPVVARGPDGTTYVTFSGCDKMPTGVGMEEVDGLECYHSPLFRSDGNGWASLLENGRLHPDAPFSGGDTVVRVGENGTVFVLYMDPQGLTLLRSDDRGETWEWMPRPLEGTRDRPWLDVSGDQHLHLVYRVGSAVFATDSPDGGMTWTPAHQITGEHWGLSEIRHVEGCGDHVAFTTGHRTSRPAVPPFNDAFTLHLATGRDGNWTVEELPFEVLNAVAGTHFESPMGFLALDVGSDCVPHIAWAQESDPGGVSEGGTVMYATRDEEWTVERVPLAEDAVMPWLRVEEDTVYIAAYARERVGVVDLPWSVQLARGPDWDIQMIDEMVHVGEFCTSNPFCVPTDRSLLDHLYLDLDVHGLIIAYGAEPVAPDVKQMRVAVAPR